MKIFLLSFLFLFLLFGCKSEDLNFRSGAESFGFNVVNFGNVSEGRIELLYHEDETKGSPIFLFEDQEVHRRFIDGFGMKNQKCVTSFRKFDLNPDVVECLLVDFDDGKFVVSKTGLIFSLNQLDGLRKTMQLDKNIHLTKNTAIP